MAPCAKIEIMDKNNERFDEMVEKVFQTASFKAQCVGAKGMVNITYARRYMKSRATVLVYSSRDTCTERGGCFCGFGLGYIKRVDGASVLYIDLVCSQEKIGRGLLQALEAYGAGSKANVAALRAATPDLVSVYEKRGYHRLADACAPPSRAGRIALRELNKYAGPVGAGGKGVFTDGVRVAKSPADAWRVAKQVRPTRAPATLLPNGWMFEEGAHGWWLSKCLDGAVIIDTKKVNRIARATGRNRK